MLIVAKNLLVRYPLALFFRGASNTKIITSDDYDYYQNPSLLYSLKKYKRALTKKELFYEYRILMSFFKGDSLESLKKWKRTEKDIMFDILDEELHKKEHPEDTPEAKEFDKTDNRPKLDTLDSIESIITKLGKDNA